MRRSRVKVTAAAMCGALLIAAGLTGFAATDAAGTNAVQAVAAIQKAAPATVSNIASTTSNLDTAVQATVAGGASVSVPVDAAAGVQLDAPGAAPDFTIGLPFGKQAARAADSQKAGVVVYDNNNGSSTVPVIHQDGTVQINTVIRNANAPTRYDYPIHLPANASLMQAPDGTVIVLTTEGEPLAVFGAAWAKDAHGKAVPTHYAVHGNTLTQFVDHNKNTAYPVVADPSTGVYSYNCVLTNGSSYFMATGSRLTNCKGSFLQKYINGAKVQTVSLVYGGHYDVKVTGRGGCLVSLGGVAALAFFPPTATWGWFASAALAAGGITSSCTGF